MLGLNYLSLMSKVVSPQTDLDLDLDLCPQLDQWMGFDFEALVF